MVATVVNAGSGLINIQLGLKGLNLSDAEPETVIADVAAPIDVLAADADVLPAETPLEEKGIWKPVLEAWETDKSSQQLILPTIFAKLQDWAPCPYLQKFRKDSSGVDKQLRGHYVRGNNDARIGPIVFVTPEVGRWSTVGGLGVMVWELAQMLTQLGEDVYVISPYYNKNTKGESGYLAKDNINYSFNVKLWIGEQNVEVGVHEGVVDGVKVLFMHHGEFFPAVYPKMTFQLGVKSVCLIAKGSLELLCQKRVIPAVIITNDWFTGLAPAYSKCGQFGDVFRGTTFFHLVHNLESSYQGQIYDMNRDDRDRMASSVLGLPVGILAGENDNNFNLSRAALLSCDTWGTVSTGYRFELLERSGLKEFLRKHLAPFAFPNGVPVTLRLEKLKEVLGPELCHSKAKALLQAKYFNNVDASIPLFAFVGRLVEQKGVHLITRSIEDLARKYEGKIQILVGGKCLPNDGYGGRVSAELMRNRGHLPHVVWADTSAFFTDGPLVNLGADFGLMPSCFEPGGIVQQEFFCAATPVVAFRTGGLADTVHEYDRTAQKGNGFVFDRHDTHNFQQAVSRAVDCYRSPADYVQIRKNARESVVDAMTVAWAWLGEFYRLKGRQAEYESRVNQAFQLDGRWATNSSEGRGLTLEDQ
eukprot:CAMPEP_0196653188 /NCGR_PEP_ID=MMETSP1086-20130531/2781_1 /TAXON_ID=77921 /ORGANISM="Cyanoptyche  gloeocystis , Strain SAG4.97" /LENGTH=643 /DNA_ID=CAMNT_0041984253 /DNA_START=70 /DNA_END=2002 /DNA_ORIENTATION=-